MLAQIARKNPYFLEGYRRVCEGAGVALYERAEGVRAKGKGSRVEGSPSTLPRAASESDVH
jgi:hypothetical protein